MSGFSHDLAGGQGNLVADSFQSPNFTSGVQGWQVTRDGDAEFNNGTFRGTVTGGVFEGADFIINTAGAFFYSASIGGSAVILDEAGNPVLDEAAGEVEAEGPGGGSATLLASIASAAGTDDFGNSYLAGICVYSGGLTVQLTDGTAQFYPFSGPTQTPAEIFAETGTLVLTSPTETSGDTQGQLVVVSAAAYASASAAMVVGPAGIKVTVPITAGSWQNITLDSGWTAGPQVPQYRMLPDGNVQVRGQAAHASVTAVTYINQSNPVPSAYRPPLTRYYRASDPGDTAGMIQANPDGTFQVRASSSYPATQAILDGTYSLA